MFPAGIAALLLQSLHPLAMAGVAGHSGYRGDPWGRLQRTSRYLATTTYGTIDDAEAAIARVRGIHERVRGRDHHGRPYRASDPHLLRWVHVAETYSFLNGHRAYGVRPLTSDEADEYVAQCAVPGRLLGVTDPPEDVASLDAQLADFRPELESTPAARQAARFLLLNPPLPWAARPGYGALALGGIGVLPPWAPRMLRLPRGPLLQRSARTAGALSSGTVRWAMAGVARAPVADSQATAQSGAHTGAQPKT